MGVGALHEELHDGLGGAQEAADDSKTELGSQQQARTPIVDDLLAVAARNEGACTGPTVNRGLAPSRSSSGGSTRFVTPPVSPKTVINW